MEREEDLLTVRGFLDRVKNKATQGKQKAEEYKDKAKGTSTIDFLTGSSNVAAMQECYKITNLICCFKI